MRSTLRTRTALAGVLAAVALGTAACGSSSTASPGSTAPASALPAATASMTATTSTASAPFGSACASVPTTGAGSFSGMAQDPVATAASNNPALSTLVTAVKAAGLVDTLKGPGPFTVFAPTNAAFAKLPKATLDDLLKPENKDKLVKILTYHVVAGNDDAKAVMGATTLKSVEGDDINVMVKDGKVMVGNDKGWATVTKPDIKTSNGTIHWIDSVIMP